MRDVPWQWRLDDCVLPEPANASHSFVETPRRVVRSQVLGTHAPTDERVVKLHGQEPPA
jgi:hypothetical protein